jgi:endonuclease III
MVAQAAQRTALASRVRRINRELARLYPGARIELNFASPLELLVAAVLSAQTTDRKVNEVTRLLFARYRTAADYAAADQAELAKVIEPAGYFHAKAKTLIALGQALCDRFGGEVPDTLGELVTMPFSPPVA